ncbi:transposase [Leptospira borgpetersenii]|uniref:transposase n=1 Tax=Leptospira borgpetersenii TaxID=174 RepID=UPI0002E1140E|nr:transposase [Leptospira borgpetersenii]ANH01654.1 Uncharacterized protein LB4E_2406 [Leptospira borgpetersenii str. 4E]MDQ7243783.1 transposase [Leptospira borgpetersenii]PTM48860.1 putative transposase of IS4/5 family DUF4096 [Leptospira borgpetersenii serovar Javanica]
MDKYHSEVLDALWKKIGPLIPKDKVNLQGGCNRVPARVVITEIIYRIKIGCQWCATPSNFGSGQACHRRFQEWERAGIFKNIYSASLNLDNGSLKERTTGKTGSEPF